MKKKYIDIFLGFNYFCNKIILNHIYVYMFICII